MFALYDYIWFLITYGLSTLIISRPFPFIIIIIRGLQQCKSCHPNNWLDFKLSTLRRPPVGDAPLVALLNTNSYVWHFVYMIVQRTRSHSWPRRDRIRRANSHRGSRQFVRQSSARLFHRRWVYRWFLWVVSNYLKTHIFEYLKRFHIRIYSDSSELDDHDRDEQEHEIAEEAIELPTVHTLVKYFIPFFSMCHTYLYMFLYTRL